MQIQHLAHQHVGCAVTVHTRYGVHHGILHHIDQNGMYLRLFPQHGGYGGQMDGTMMTGEENVDAVILSQDADAGDLTGVFFPFFFIPFAAALAFSPYRYWW